jgi:hypothetical protein
VAKVLAEVLGAGSAAGTEGTVANTDGVVVFIFNSLDWRLWHLGGSKQASEYLNHRVFTDAIQLYIHDANHS